MKPSYFNNKAVSTLAAIAIASAGFLLSTSASRATVFIYNISVPTNDLNANPSDAPYALFFQLADGSGTGDGNNTATINNFNVSGPASPIVLTDNTPFATDQEPFTVNPSPNSLLTFTVSLTNNTDVGPNPDEFSFYVLADASSPGTTTPIPTTDPVASSLFTIDLGGFSPTAMTFQGTGNFSDISPDITSVPEPSPSVVVMSAFIGVGALIASRRRFAVTKSA